ncbi:rod shape-determining protein MreC [Robiginitalea aurantiaca]|uniref:Cell shape-determining protein MreC n=1 Tax=Robiginitalea aurantiaca TaxID=3056915 RepID=A0ABT7WF43_9FLAO|nr:rod shape-determining protein MreC [Robiginitalea aurantiaca]MDM9631528.1 rod shape-determining protein MreC [Robiginitalea aurantiaca]
MQRIINFILNNKNTLLYVLLFIISIFLTIQNSSYHQARYFNSANWLSGNIYGMNASVRGYFNLNEENQKLLEENQRLRSLLFNIDPRDTIEMDTASLTYEVFPARVVKNSYAEPDNYITLDRGSSDSIVQDMGVITSKGILGIVEKSSSGFSSVQSVLNSKSNINAKILHTDYFGSLKWDQEDYRVVQLEDIPRLDPAPMKVGDTIVTGAMSSIFPENIPIGTIDEIELNQAGSSYKINVHLFNDMTNLRYAYIIRNRKRPEVLNLEKEVANDR